MSDANTSSAGNPRANLPLSDVMLRRLKLKPLLIFERVLSSSSIARAARELNLTQPAVTKAIHELEADLDVPLFERTNRGVTPTCYGTLLGTRVKTVIAELRYLTDELNTFRTGDSGHVIIGAAIPASAPLLPQAITRLKQQRPGVLITVRNAPADQLFPALATGELDIVVGSLPEHDLPPTRVCAFGHSVLYREALCAVAGCRHPLAKRADIQLSDLLDWPWIFPLQGSPARLTTERLFLDAGLGMPTNVVESQSVLTNIGLMQDSPSISLMPRAAARHFANLNLLSILALGDLGALGDSGDIGYSIRTDREPTPAAQAFIACLKEAAATC
ncbi:transcriptional regulator [Herbaspirillum sp. CF444]|uniref:LysR family transcriptional regulator n=1 Tax=Herbaspirillum sp. CF444 TaxID=1144319 RepID=UPI0002724B7B|nr:LysR family transcriptional regulator [Herbaspirillum sp. CF444]EJL92657.1 transcriptional regulator [Herbaspirillum sp. CF444]